jgi:outer membrane protein TolC
MKNGIQDCVGIRFILLAALLLFSMTSFAEPVTLRHAIELALQHANGIAISAADEQHASASLRELNNSYIPQLNAGAGIGKSDGFPLSLEGAAPSLFNVNAQSPVINLGLREFIKATRAEVKVSAFYTKDQRNQVIQDVVLSYAELAKWQQRLTQLRQAQATERKTEAAVEDRVKEGVDSEVEISKARLSVARVRLRIAEASGSADVLREHLSKLTGLPPSSIDADSDSVPAMPVPEQGDSASENASQEKISQEKTSEDSPTVEAAVEHARAQYLRVEGERRSLWPSVDFAAQYANLATYNNSQKYYQKGSFQPNNATVGVAIHLPFLNLAQHARVREAEADALKAAKQADAARNQASEETLRLQRSVTHTAAARDVGQLEYDIARQNIAAIETRMNSGGANLHDLDNAQTQASEKLIALQDVTFELERTQVSLLRATGKLESWALETK